MAAAIQTSFIQQFDNSGNPLNGGSVTVYDAGTTDTRIVYSDDALGLLATNPIILDSAGRHAMRYTATTAYKIVVKNSAGTTIYTRDDIDPGVPVGSGSLPIASGGTGATNAATALSNLGGVSAATVADLEADVAALAGASSSSEKTHLATGTTGQRPASPAAGDIRHNTTTTEVETYISGGWDNVMTETANKAGTADVTAESTSSIYVTPGRMKYHSGVAKAWARVEAADSSPSYVDSYGFATGTPITDHGNGAYTLTLTTALADANYVVIGSALSTGAARIFHVHTVAAGTIRVLITASDGTATDADFTIAVFGDF
jgi:hypothetical protein